MWRSIIIALTLICLVLLGWFAVRKYPGRIEADLQARAQSALGAKGGAVEGVIIKASQRDVVLGGRVASEADKQAAAALVADLSGVKSVTNQIAVGPTTEATPEPTPATAEAAITLEVTWTGTTLTLSGELPRALSSEVDQKLVTAFDTDAITVDRKTVATEGTPLPESGPAVAAGLEALALSVEGQAKVRGRALAVVAIISDPALEAKLRAIVEKVGGAATVSIKGGATVESVVDATGADDATTDTATDGAVAEVLAEVAVADVGPEVVEVQDTTAAAAAEVAPAEAVAPGAALTAAQCKTMIAAAVEGDKRITFRSNTGRLTDEGDKRLQEVAALLARCPNATGIIEGYHDDYGEPDRLKQLTQIRAYNVHKRLGDLGIDPKRFRYIGLGYRNMRYHGAPAVRILNQRIEFNITVE